MTSCSVPVPTLKSIATSMTRHTTMFLSVLICLCLSASGAFAHTKYRLVGTITGHILEDIQVQTKEGKKIWVATTVRTAITRDGKKVPASELKKGLGVVVEAVGDNLDSLVAEQIHVGPAAARKGK